MGWRIVIVTTASRLNYKNRYLVVRNEELKMIHLSEINTIILENPQISISNYLINELVKNKVQLICCDERHNPTCELVPYYQSHNTSLKVQKQAEWESFRKQKLKTHIIYNKIQNQRNILKKYNHNEHYLLQEYLDQLEFDDVTNREGHAAKVYFNALFSKSFSRENDCNINAKLDYGYAIILSCFNREIVAQGYITQLGINHKNQFNEFNLSCDLMEPFRAIVDDFVISNQEKDLDAEMKHLLVNILNNKIIYKGKELFISWAIREYITDCVKYLNGESDEYFALDYGL